MDPLQKDPIWKTNRDLGFVPFITARNIAWRRKKTTFQEGGEIPFDSVRQVKSSFSQIKLGLNRRILMQTWARLAVNRSDPKRS